MARSTLVFLFVLFVIQAQAQVFSRGVPAGATSPEPDGRIHGIPSNVQSPTPIPLGVHPIRPIRTFNPHGPVRRFGNPRHRAFAPVPVFYPIYGYGDVGYPADPYVQPTPDQAEPAADREQQEAANDGAGSDEALRDAYLQGARDALKQERDQARYGDHYLDSREQQQSPSNQDRAARRPAPKEEAPAPAAKEDDSPAAVFIFKDGHQIETRNYAIMGQTLYDFSSSVLKKVQLADLDRDATSKANDDRGITVKLP